MLTWAIQETRTQTSEQDKHVQFDGRNCKLFPQIDTYDNAHAVFRKKFDSEQMFAIN